MLVMVTTTATMMMMLDGMMSLGIHTAGNGNGMRAGDAASREHWC